jgi:hypothetical protein
MATNAAQDAGQLSAMRGVRANAVVLDERQLTRRVSDEDVRRTYEEFQQRTETGGLDVDAELIMSTVETTESRASDLLDLGGAALARLFGRDARTDVSVITAQDAASARLRVSAAGVKRVAEAMGVGSVRTEELENFLSQRISTEYQLLLLKFDNTDILPNPDITIELVPSGRTLVVSRAQQFR